MTLEPHPELTELVHSVPHTCVACGELGVQDLILNVLLFIPLGLGLRLSRLAWWKALVICVLTTVAVETLQYTVIAGRHASLGDVLSNSIGGGLGILLAQHWRALVFPTSRGAVILALVGMLAWLGLQALSAALLTIALPRTPYWVLWLPDIPAYYARFDGTILDARLGVEVLPNGRVDHSGSLRAQLESDRFALQVRARGHSGGPGLAPIIFMVDESDGHIVLLAQDGGEIFFRVRMRAWDFKLRGPAIRLALPRARPDDSPLRIRAGIDQARLFLELSRGTEEHRRQLALSPSWGWSFLLPNEYGFGSEAYFLTALWIAGLLLPLAYWTGRAASSGAQRPTGLALLLVIAIGLGVLPVGMQMAAVHWSEWFAASVGLGLGWLLSDLAGSAPP